MKRTLATIAALMVAMGTYGQGTLSFNNRLVGTVDAPVSRADGTGAGAGFTAQLFVVGTGGSLTALTPTTTFRTGSAAAAFYVNAVDVTVPGHAAGTAVTLRMEAFNGADFNSSGIRGQSTDFTITLGGDKGDGSPPSPPAAISGFQGFSVIPEPSTIALGILGLGALLIRRRK